MVKDKKRGNVKLGRLDLLKRKLELEQKMLDSGQKSESKEIEEIEEQLDEDEPEKKTERDTKKSEEEQEEQLKEDTANKVAAISRNAANAAKDDKKTEVKFAGIKDFSKKVKKYQELFDNLRKEVSKIVVGQEQTVNGMIRALIADGHVLVEGVPGIAKTTLIRTLAQTTNCSFSRIQFTPDLLPTDIVGISTYQEGRGFYTLKGPIFSNFILADEINRAPPKVQSALLECMAEKQATIAKESFPIPLPFFTMATQNPVENVGTYTLPEAQIDRFLFKLYMGYPTIDDEQQILRSNITTKSFDNYKIQPVLSPDIILQIQADAKQVYMDKKVERYIVKIIDATRNSKKYGINSGKYIEYGSSPRGSIGLFSASQAEAMMCGQTFVTPHNVKTVAHDVLRHRIILSYEGQAEGVKSEEVIDEILKKIPVP